MEKVEMITKEEVLLYAKETMYYSLKNAKIWFGEDSEMYRLIEEGVMFLEKRSTDYREYIVMKGKIEEDIVWSKALRYAKDGQVFLGRDEEFENELARRVNC